VGVTQAQIVLDGRARNGHQSPIDESHDVAAKQKRQNRSIRRDKPARMHSEHLPSSHQNLPKSHHIFSVALT
jgi:hypothetical protein